MTGRADPLAADSSTFVSPQTGLVHGAIDGDSQTWCGRRQVTDLERGESNTMHEVLTRVSCPRCKLVGSLLWRRSLVTVIDGGEAGS